jgi:acetyl-CoA carboxylase biotin carboxyl carrier protein
VTKGARAKEGDGADEAPAAAAAAAAAGSMDPLDPGSLPWLERLVELMGRGDLAALTLDNGKRRVELRRRDPLGSAAGGWAAPVLQVRDAGGSSPSAGPAPGAAAGAGSGPAPQAGKAAAGGGGDGVGEVRSPMVGTLYRSPAPDAPPFVEVGDRVAEDTTLCIIEAMKVMNEIKAEVEGVVVEVLVQNGEAVEYGQPLFRIRRAR